jgi:hypothetical protein
MNRYFALRPLNPGLPTALRVTLTSLHHPDPPNVPEAPPPDLTGAEGEVRWIGEVSTCADSDTLGSSFKCARLQCDPAFIDWSADLAGATLYVTGSEVAPSSTYEVQAITEGCDVQSEAAYSPPRQVSTARWGDIVAAFQAPSPATLTQPDVLDISAQVDKLKDLASAVIKPRSQLLPADVDPHTAISVLEVSRTVDGVKSAAYPFTIAQSCP